MSTRSRPAGTTPTDPVTRSVGTFRFTVPVDWRALSKTDLRGARREFEGLMKPSYAGPVTLESFEYFLLPDSSGMFIASTIRIAEQKDLLPKIREQEAANMERCRRQGQITRGTCDVVKVSGADVVKVDMDRVNGAKSVNFYHWSSDSPGVMSMLQLGLLPRRNAKAESDAKEMLDSLTVTTERRIETSPARQPHRTYSESGISLEYPDTWRSFPSQGVSEIGANMTTELRKHGRTLMSLGMFISPFHVRCRHRAQSHTLIDG